MGTVIVALALVAIVGLIVWSMVKDKKKENPPAAVTAPTAVRAAATRNKPSTGTSEHDVPVFLPCS